MGYIGVQFGMLKKKNKGGFSCKRVQLQELYSSDPEKEKKRVYTLYPKKKSVRANTGFKPLTRIKGYYHR